MQFLCLLLCVVTLSAYPWYDSEDETVNVEHADIEKYPFSVLYNVFYTDMTSHFCSGTLLTPQWVITAAHCFDSERKISKVVILLGSDEIVLSDGLVLTTRTTKLDPDFDRLTFENDIGFLKLTDPVLVTDKIRPIGRLALEPFDGKEVRVISWMDTDYDVIPDALQYVDLKVLGLSECGHYINEVYVPNHMSCARSLRYLKVDDGSPVVSEISKGVFSLVGIGSFYVKDHGHLDDALIFVRTSDYYYDLIKSITGFIQTEYEDKDYFSIDLNRNNDRFADTEENTNDNDYDDNYFNNYYQSDDEYSSGEKNYNSNSYEAEQPNGVDIKKIVDKLKTQQITKNADIQIYKNNTIIIIQNLNIMGPS